MAGLPYLLAAIVALKIQDRVVTQHVPSSPHNHA